VTDFAHGEHGWSADLRAKLSEFRAELGLRVCWDMNEKNARGELWTDWGIWSLPEPSVYEQRLRDLAAEKADWGSRPEAYQSVLGAPGQRDFGSRLDAMGLACADVRYRTLIDVGCNLGNFVRWAEECGARRAWGVDLPHVCDVAREVANWCRAWNSDFVGIRLPRGEDCAELLRDATGRERFDVVLALAVDRQVGYGPWWAELVKPGGSFWLEGHVPDKRRTYEDRLARDFDEVEFLGMSRDHGPRPIFKCKRGSR